MEVNIPIYNGSVMGKWMKQFLEMDLGLYRSFVPNFWIIVHSNTTSFFQAFCSFRSCWIVCYSNAWGVFQVAKITPTKFYEVGHLPAIYRRWCHSICNWIRGPHLFRVPNLPRALTIEHNFSGTCIVANNQTPRSFLSLQVWIWIYL